MVERRPSWMIVDIDRTPFQPGEERALRIDGDAGEYEVEIMCIVQSPPPPGVRGCSECGRIHLRRGAEGRVRASNIFRDVSGFVRLKIRSSNGEEEQIDLEVIKVGGTHGQSSGQTGGGLATA